MSKFSVQNAISGSVVYGDPRGDGSTDLQFSRTASTEVASGYASLITGGARNTASGDFAVVIGGLNNTSSGEGAVCAGSGNTAAGLNSLALGYQCQAIGDGSVAMGAGSISNGTLSMAIGSGAVTNAPYSAIVNSEFSTNTSTAVGSVVLSGTQAIAYLPGQLVTHSRNTFQALGTPGELGTMQVSELLMFRQAEFPGIGASINLELTLDGNIPAIINQLIMYGNDKVWNITADTTITNTADKTVMISKDVIGVKKVFGNVTAVYIDNISKKGDSALTSTFTVSFLAGSGGVDLQIFASGTLGFSPNSRVIRVATKLNIVELKNQT
jgi:hypothetical protein